MKCKICINVDSKLLDKIQVFGNGEESLDDLIEKTLEHMFECNVWWDKNVKE